MRRKFSAKRRKNLLSELYTAIDSANINLINKILTSDDSIINKDDGRGTPLQYACTVADNLNVDVVKFLISHGANPYGVNLNGWQSSPEIKNFIALQKKLAPIIRKLIKNGRTKEYYDFLSLNI